MVSNYLKNKLAPLLFRLWGVAKVHYSISEQIISDLMANATNDLNKFEHKTYSQYGEDGIIEEIFARIGTKSKYFVEVGSGSGLENNTINLLMEGWRGVWVDADQSYQKVYHKLFPTSLEAGHLKIDITKVSSSNINELLDSYNLPEEIDLFSLDVDGNDYYIWKAMKLSPRVVVVEYNAIHSARSLFLQREDNTNFWTGGNFYGSGIKKLNDLALEKNYVLVACNLSGNNAFFIRKDLMTEQFSHAGNVEKLYQKPRYHLSYFAGSKPTVGEWVQPH